MFSLSSLSPLHAPCISFVPFPFPCVLSLSSSSCLSPIQSSELLVELTQWMGFFRTLNQDFSRILGTGNLGFWSMVCFNESFKTVLGTWMAWAKKMDIEQCERNDEIGMGLNKIQKMFEKVARKVCVIMVRLTVWDCFQEKSEQIGKMLYDSKVFDIPMLVDFCLIYGEENEAIVRNVMTRIFEIAPIYYEDLEKFVSIAADTLRTQISKDLNAQCIFFYLLFFYEVDIDSLEDAIESLTAVYRVFPDRRFLNFLISKHILQFFCLAFIFLFI